MHDPGVPGRLTSKQRDDDAAIGAELQSVCMKMSQTSGRLLQQPSDLAGKQSRA